MNRQKTFRVIVYRIANVDFSLHWMMLLLLLLLLLLLSFCVHNLPSERTSVHHTQNVSQLIANFPHPLLDMGTLDTTYLHSVFEHLTFRNITEVKLFRDVM